MSAHAEHGRRRFVFSSDSDINGPHTILVYRRLAQNPSVIVPPLDEAEVEQLLSAAPIDPDRARSLGVQARRGLSQVRRALARHATFAIPPWIRGLCQGSWTGLRRFAGQAAIGIW